MNEICNIPIIINEEMRIFNKDEAELFKFKTMFTLLELIKSIVDSVSFMGPPSLKEFSKEVLNISGVNIMDKNELLKKYNGDDEDDEAIQCRFCGNNTCKLKLFDKPKDICANCFNKAKVN